MALKNREDLMEMKIKELKDKTEKVMEFEDDLFNEKELSDFQVIAGDKTFHVSKLMLAKRSPVMKRMFLSKFKESSEGIMKLKDDPEAVEALLKYIYMNKKFEGFELAMKLVQLAHRYDINDLTDQCELVLLESVSMENVDEIFDLARRLGLKLLQLKCNHVWFTTLNLEDEESQEDFDFTITPEVVDFRTSDTSIHTVTIKNRTVEELSFVIWCDHVDVESDAGQQEDGVSFAVRSAPNRFSFTLTRKPTTRFVVGMGLWSQSKLQFVKETQIQVLHPRCQ